MNIQNRDLNSLLENFIKSKSQKENDNLSSFQDKLVSQVVKKFLSQEQNSLQNIQESKIKNQEASDTISLSLIQEEQQLLNFDNSIEWQQVLQQYGNIFQLISHKRNYIETCKFDDIINRDSKNLIIQKSSDSIIYTGYNFNIQDWVVVKRLIVNNQQILETAQQYIIHGQIYQQYPNLFLKILLPIYVKSIQPDHLEFTSQLEYGKINLYEYSQQKKIDELELQLIFQQIYEQISLLHKHNIAHRDIKPQNIIFVENKGWLLCDFGDSIRYDNVNGIYNIRGTYSFLLPNLQQLAKIEGISCRQNLYYNDLYALAITLIVIKFQLTKQEQINEYLNNNTDSLIESLKQPQSYIEKFIIKHQFKFIKPQVMKQQEVSTENTNSYEYYITLIWIITNKHIIAGITNEIVDKIILQIDEKLGQRDKYYNSLNYICYLRMDYQSNKQLKNLMKFKQLRQCIQKYQKHYKFWRNRIAQNNNNKLKSPETRQTKIQLILQMYSMSFIDCALQQGVLFLQNDYDFTVHIIVIFLFKFLHQDDQAQLEYNQLLRYREYKYMNEDELFLFIELTLNYFPTNVIQSDIKYLENISQYQSDLDGFQFINDVHISDTEFIELFTKEFRQIKTFSKYSHGIVELFFKQLQIIFNIKNLQFILLFINQMKKEIKYNCQVFYWQKLILYQSEIEILLGNIQKIKPKIKKMNYNLLFNSESSMQSQVLRILKIIVLIQKNRLRESMVIKLTKQLFEIANNLDKIKFQLYKYILVEELISLIKQESFERKSHIYFKIMIIIFRKYLFLFDIQQQMDIIRLSQKQFIETLNYKRFNQTIKAKYVQSQTKTCFNYLRFYQSQNNNISLGNVEPLTNQFMYQQYFR